MRGDIEGVGRGYLWKESMIGVNHSLEKKKKRKKNVSPRLGRRPAIIPAYST